MSDIFNEIDDELRQERIQQFWKDNKYFIIGCIIIAIVSTASFSFIQDWKRKADIKETTAFYSALNTSDVKFLVDYTKVAKADYAALSRFAAISLLLDKNKTDEAIKLLTEIQQNRDIKKIYRDYAILIESQIAVNTYENDKLEVIEKNLIPLTDARSVWKNSAQESLALIASKKGEFDKAISIITNMENSPKLSPQMKERIAKLKSLYITQQKEKGNK